MTRARAARCGAASLIAMLVAAPAAAQTDAPFRTRNLSPLIAIFGVPAWERPTDGTELNVTSELANHYRLSRRGPETLVLDGETWRTSVNVRHAFAERWNVGVEVPYYQQSGGMLDDLIDGWHSAFGLPDGGRNHRAEDRILFLLENGPSRFFTLDGRARGLGDVQLSLGRELGPDGGFLLKGTLKLPTGDEDLLAGSGSTDLAVTLMRARTVAVRGMQASYYWGVGAMSVGDADRIEFDARDGAVLGMLGGSLQPWPRLGFKAQLDMHSPFYDSRLDELAEPGIQATIGGWWRASERGVLEFAVNEDVSVSTSPDVVMHLLFRWTF